MDGSVLLSKHGSIQVSVKADTTDFDFFSCPALAVLMETTHTRTAIILDVTTWCRNILASFVKLILPTLEGHFVK